MADLNQLQATELVRIVGSDATGAEQTPVTSTVAGELNVAANVTDIKGVADPGNSTTTPLGAGSTFTGTAFDTINYPSFVFSIKPSHASSTNGLVLQWSPDGTNWDINSVMSVAANQGRGFHVSHRGRYFRIVYTNGATLQTSFRLNVLHRPSSVGLITRPLEDTLSEDNMAQTVRAILSAKKNDGTFVNIGASNGGNLKLAIDEELPAGTQLIGLVSSKINLTPSSPTVASVGVTSAQAVASNANRKGLVLTNTSIARMSFGLGATAVLNSGITLYPGDTWQMDETSFTTGAINAIASLAASGLAIQEFS